jgi:hypothetical protein
MKDQLLKKSVGTNESIGGAFLWNVNTLLFLIAVQLKDVR